MDTEGTAKKSFVAKLKSHQVLHFDALNQMLVPHDLPCYRAEKYVYCFYYMSRKPGAYGYKQWIS